MKTNLEIEYKTLISQTDAQSLLDHFDFGPFVEQTNVYFDTRDSKLFNQKMMCRIRMINDHYEFTLKIPQPDGVLEYEYRLKGMNFNHLAIHQLFEELDINTEDLYEITRSTTKRRVFSDEYGDWCLDETRFPNHSDFEIEYELHEANEKAYPHYVDTLRYLDIDYNKAEPKYIRALRSGY